MADLVPRLGDIQERIIARRDRQVGEELRSVMADDANTIGEAIEEIERLQSELDAPSPIIRAAQILAETFATAIREDLGEIEKAIEPLAARLREAADEIDGEHHRDAREAAHGHRFPCEGRG